MEGERVNTATMSVDLVTDCEKGRKENDMIVNVDVQKDCGIIEEKIEIQNQRQV